MFGAGDRRALCRGLSISPLASLEYGVPAGACHRARRRRDPVAGTTRECMHERGPMTVVILRESGVSSTPRLIDFIAGVSGILGPLLSRGRRLECITSRHCERSEAIHGATIRKSGLLRRFAPRKDGKIRVRDLAACVARGLAGSFRPLHSEGAGNAGRPMRPPPRVQG
jgi:hypothetical protein